MPQDDLILPPHRPDAGGNAYPCEQ